MNDLNSGWGGYTAENFLVERRKANELARSIRLTPVDDIVLQKASLEQGMKVLDAGIGPGIFVKQLLELRDVELVGVDSSREFIEVAQDTLSPWIARGRVSLELVSLEEWLPPASTFHRVFCMTTIHHLPPEEMRKVAANFFYCLVPGGEILLVEDWAIPPSSLFEDLARRLRWYQMERKGPKEYHQDLEFYKSLLCEAGFLLAEVVSMPRPFQLEGFKGIEDPEFNRLLRLASEFPTEERLVRMVLIRGVVPHKQ
ncbi:hypothetical protein SY88_06495 [Clostridiales bacterium PH28_bin88]|nr:hypothetical protein SY88_06495 [Clostridiales bacterium PH28_bin88]